MLAATLDGREARPHMRFHLLAHISIVWSACPRIQRAAALKQSTALLCRTTITLTDRALPAASKSAATNRLIISCLAARLTGKRATAVRPRAHSILLLQTRRPQGL